MEKKIIDLLGSGQEENIILAFELLDSQGINPQPIFEEFRQLLQAGRVYTTMVSQSTEGYSFAEQPSTEAFMNLISKVNFLMFDAAAIRGTAISSHIQYLKKLYWLSIDRMPITDLPESLAQLEKITRIDINKTAMTNFPEVLCSIDSLERLSFLRTGVTEIPESIGQLKKIKDCCFNFNTISSLPESIGSLTSLERLEIRGNQLKTIPESIAELPNLDVLNLNDNPLETSDEHLSTLVRIKNAMWSRESYYFYVDDHIFEAMEKFSS